MKNVDLTLSTVNQAAIDETIKHIQSIVEHDRTGHDWWHIRRVWLTALHIAQKENADIFIVQLAALLHDIADWKFHDGDEKANVLAAEKWLTHLKLDTPTINHVCDIVNAVTFKGAGVANQISSLEGKVVQDADRLDAIGAIGIARAFTYGGYKSRPMHDPDIAPIMHASFEEYKNHQGTTINHFYEKVLLLKDLMNTKTGKKMAEIRHQFVVSYLDQFLSEWNMNQDIL